MAGIDLIQLRIKDIPESDFLNIAQSSRFITKKYGAKLIINDRVGVAKKVLADGVHLGQSDMPIVKAREILGKDVIIGGSTHNKKEILAMHAAGCDYIGLGPLRDSGTKKDLEPVLGIEGYKKLLSDPEIKNICETIPVIAIGGIQPEDVTELIQLGINGIAVSSAITPPIIRNSVVEDFKRLMGEP